MTSSTPPPGSGDSSAFSHLADLVTDGAEDYVGKAAVHIPVPEIIKFTNDPVKQAAGMIFVASLVMIVATLLIAHSPTFSTVFYMLFGAAGAVGLVVFAKKSFVEYKEEQREHKNDPEKAKPPSILRSLSSFSPQRNKSKGQNVR